MGNYGVGTGRIPSELSYVFPIAAEAWAGILRHMIAQLPHTMRELDSRSADGLQVRLLWSETDDRVMVAVADSKSGDDFSIDVRDGDNALDVFQHPYAYAAWRCPEFPVTESNSTPAQMRAA